LLIDDYLPEYHAREYHETTVRAAGTEVYAALWSADYGESLIVQALLGLRGLPSLFAGPRGMPGRMPPGEPPRRLTLEAFSHGGFHLLAEEPGRELLIGLVGRFWTPSGGLTATDAERFRQPLPAGTAKAAWNFTVEEIRPGRARLATETRVFCSDGASLRAFRCYWIVIRPFSGLIRRFMLRAVRRAVGRGVTGCAERPR
jgi:hypothetical protein